MDDTLSQTKLIIATLFNVDEESLSPESSPATVPGWDSMGQLMLVLELEQVFDIQIAPEQAERLGSIAAIVELVKALPEPPL
jgi:acyl carrier protein